MGFEPTTASLEGSLCRVANSAETDTSEKQPLTGVVPGVVSRRGKGSIPVYSHSITDPELPRLVAAWPTLPDPIKAAIRALIGTAEFS
jgi:hypothetical protein